MKQNQSKISRVLQITSVAFALASFTPLHAVPTPVVSQDEPRCDVLDIPVAGDLHPDGSPIITHEIGEPFMMGGNFPVDQSLVAMDRTGGIRSCPPEDDPLIPQVTVIMFNMSGRSFSDVWYIADEDTTVSAFDGIITSDGNVQAFKIDNVGANKPLIFESMTADGIWENGERWDFVLQDYVNTGGLAPSLFSTIGLNSPGPFSSGNILAIPEPSRAMLLVLGVMGLVLKRRRA